MKATYTAEKLYPLTPSQKLILYQQKFCINKNVQHIPFYFTTDRKFDFALMKRAVREEIARNDAMRLRLIKKRGEVYQFFPKTLDIGEIPVYSFKTQEEQDNVLSKAARDTLHPLKNEFYRIILFETHEGRHGVFMVSHHLAMDAIAIHNFFRDVCEMYDALADGTEMPSPSSFESAVVRDLALEADTEKRQMDIEYIKELMASEGEPYYCGIEGKKSLDRFRVKKKDPSLRCTPIFDPFHEKTERYNYSFSSKLVEEIREYCRMHNIGVQHFISSAFRVYLSAINRNANDVSFFETVSRRATAADRAMGGCMVHAFSVRTLFTDDEPFSEMTQNLAKRYLQIYRHSNCPTIPLLSTSHDVYHHAQTNDYSTLVYTFMPATRGANDGWNRTFGGYNPGNFSHKAYLYVHEDCLGGGITCSFTYRVNIISEADAKNMFEQTKNILEKAIIDPDMTIGELKKAITLADL